MLKITIGSREAELMLGGVPVKRHTLYLIAVTENFIEGGVAKTYSKGDRISITESIDPDCYYTGNKGRWETISEETHAYESLEAFQAAGWFDQMEEKVLRLLRKPKMAPEPGTIDESLKEE
jgi:hypothetical protein